ncbi:hypothetical protein F2Q69_00035529 [Brassica cretica]|uniref:Pectinesterase inhibitor domain-containing protein n=1 Tax=Brassica cretica TaxID=69181 RepID=A0A8S9SQW7_BRACR|nr:hypothetical protein F2Q69_00035529 [Brassica cretica]
MNSGWKTGGLKGRTKVAEGLRYSRLKFIRAGCVQGGKDQHMGGAISKGHGTEITKGEVHDRIEQGGEIISTVAGACALACEVGRESQAPVRSDCSSGHGSSQSYFPDVYGMVQYNARSVCPHIKLSLRVASKKVSNLSVSFRSINDMPEETVVGDYVKLYADAVSQLNESISKFKREKKNGGNWLTKRVVGDVKTWISATMTDDETCSDGLEEMGTVVGNEIKKEMFTVNQMMSISLAIVSQMKKLLIIFH